MIQWKYQLMKKSVLDLVLYQKICIHKLIYKINKISKFLRLGKKIKSDGINFNLIDQLKNQIVYF
jgi:hypothetical protein